MNVKEIAKIAYTAVSAHSTEISVGLGIGGMIAAGVMAVKETPKALKVIELAKFDIKMEKYASSEEDDVEVDPDSIVIPAKTKLLLYLRCYWKELLLAGVSSGLIIAATIKQKKALTTATMLYLAAEQKLNDIDNAMIESGKYDEFVEKISGYKLDKTPAEAVPAPESYESNEVFEVKKLFVDSWSGKMFRMTDHQLASAIVEFNRMLQVNEVATIADWLDILNVTPSESGEYEGFEWNNDPVDYHRSGSVLAPTGEEATVMSFDRRPAKFIDGHVKNFFA